MHSESRQCKTALAVTEWARHATRPYTFMVIALLVAATGSWNSALAAPSESEIVKAVEAEKILGPDYKLSVAVKGEEATVSTYINKDSLDPDKDIKIDAVLLARKIMQIAPEITRVKALFFDFGGKHWREVVVKAGDIQAYGAGQTERDKLLNSLEVVSHTSEPICGGGEIGEAPNAQQKSKDAEKPGAQKIAAAAPAKAPELTDATYAAMHFAYPSKNWVLKAGKQGSIKLVSQRFGGTEYISFSVSQTPDTVAGLSAKDQQDWTSMQDSSLVFNKPVRFGRNKSLGGLGWMTTYYSSSSDYPEYQYYQRSVYFGWPRRVYSIGFHSQAKHYHPVNADFEKILASLHFATVGPQPGDAASVKSSKSTTARVIKKK